VPRLLLQTEKRTKEHYNKIWNWSVKNAFLMLRE